MQSRGAPEGTFDGAPKDTLSDLHKDAQEGACEVALKGALEIALELQLWLHLLMQWLIHGCVQNFSSKDGPAAAIESAIDGGFNVGFEWAPQSYLWKQLKMHNKATMSMHLTFYLI